MNALGQRIAALIAAEGPLTIAQYMTLALHDPEGGYYATRDPFGAGGDFVTAPEISQMFGELIGLFLVQAWEDRGAPAPFHLVELGPGRGTLMADLLRAARLRPEFIAAARITLVESSPHLRGVQKRTLLGFDVRWADALDDIPRDAPLFLVANEFLDALPLRQFVFAQGHWRERMVTLLDGALAFGLTPDAAPIPGLPREAPEGAVIEICLPALATAAALAERMKTQGGAALIVDYGYAQSRFGDSFQALKAHRHAEPLAEPGEADLTAHVDFGTLARYARGSGAAAFGPVTQGTFLEALGIAVRAETLRRSDPAKAADVDSELARLTADEQMGTLFKAMALAAPGSPPLPGFDG